MPTNARDRYRNITDTDHPEASLSIYQRDVGGPGMPATRAAFMQVVGTQVHQDDGGRPSHQEGQGDRAEAYGQVQIQEPDQTREIGDLLEDWIQTLEMMRPIDQHVKQRRKAVELLDGMPSLLEKSSWS